MIIFKESDICRSKCSILYAYVERRNKTGSKLFFREKDTLLKIEKTGDHFQGVWLTRQQMQCSFCQCRKEGKDWCSKEKKMEKVGEEQKKRRPLFAGLSWLPLSTGILAILICVVTWVQLFFLKSWIWRKFCYIIRDEWIDLTLEQKENDSIQFNSIL